MCWYDLLHPRRSVSDFPYKNNNKQTKNSPTFLPNCSYPSALLPLPHQRVPGNIQDLFLRPLPSAPSRLVRSVNSGARDGESAHGASRDSSMLMLNPCDTSSPRLSFPSHESWYPSVTLGCGFISHETSRASSVHLVRYRSRAPAASSRRNVTSVCPSVPRLETLRQDAPGPVTAARAVSKVKQHEKKTARRPPLFIVMSAFPPGPVEDLQRLKVVVLTLSLPLRKAWKWKHLSLVCW